MRSERASRFGALILFVAGAAFIALATVAMLTDRDTLAGGFGVLALLSFTMAALAPRMQGQVTASLNGFRFELVREVVDAGDRAGSPDALILEAVRNALSEQDLASDAAPPDDEEPDTDFRDPRATQAAIQPSADDLLADARRALDQRIVGRWSNRSAHGGA
ncbi:hypothetical protein ACFWY5_46720 [Nonomuraea sp. NPDC059007]|uniref:hypothetical protein n=1 Tax=Nonomuraea sp. NPDC059007 TaxID=3346692 RepID=UPI0036C04DAF